MAELFRPRMRPSFPMARHGAVFDLCRTLADEEFWGNERFATPALFADMPSDRAQPRPWT